MNATPQKDLWAVETLSPDAQNDQGGGEAVAVLTPRLAERMYAMILAWVYAPLLLPFILTDQQEMIIADVRRWNEVIGLQKGFNLAALQTLLATRPALRILYWNRVRQGRPAAMVALFLLRIFYRDCLTLYIHCDSLGPGLFIQHGFATTIGAQRIGRNCWINQQVTVGFRNDGIGQPVIGDNVTIFAGAKVLGGITIGNNVTIGANAVVINDVPDNCVVVGVPARIVKVNGVRVRASDCRGRYKRRRLRLDGTRQRPLSVDVA